MTIVDADDFHDQNHRLDLLFQIKQAIPEFKITLFAVPGLCGAGFLEGLRKIDWIDLVPHGWFHPHPRECENWSYAESIAYLDRIDPLGWTKGFKAPGWQISDGMYQALLERGYWVCDQPYNNQRRPTGLPVYLTDRACYKHHHIQDACGNGLEECIDTILTYSAPFGFMKDAI